MTIVNPAANPSASNAPKPLATAADAEAFLNGEATPEENVELEEATDEVEPTDSLEEALEASDNTDEESADDTEEDEKQPDGDKKPGRWQKAQKAKKEAIARANAAEAELATWERNSDELVEHARHFAESNQQLHVQNKQLESEIVRLRARMNDVDLPEYGSQHERELSQARAELEEVKMWKQSQEAEATSRQEAQRTERARGLAGEISQTAKKYGLDRVELLKSMQVLAGSDSTITPESVAQRLVAVKGTKRKSADAKSQAQHNRNAGPSVSKPGGGLTNAQNFDMADPNGPLNFLKSLEQ